MFNTFFADESGLSQETNILGELSTALNKLQATILEEKDVVVDTRKRNTILTLIAWLKRILQSSSNDNNNTSNADAQLFALTDLLPTELLLTKLMPQLNANNHNNSNTNNNSNTTNKNNNTMNDEACEQNDDRSPASSRRFSRQRNNRFNTVGVSKEELADARLYLQKKLLSENLASTATKVNEIDQQNILDESDESRRKSLNLSLLNDLDNDLQNIFNNAINSISKSIDVVTPSENSNIQNTVVKTSNNAHSEQTTIQAKVNTRRKSNEYNRKDDDEGDATSDDEHDQMHYNNNQRKTSNGSIGSTSNKSMNKFALRKLKMKRANTIDIPKAENVDDFGSDYGNSDSNNNKTLSNANEMQHQSNRSIDIDKNHLPELKLKSSHDKKYLAFMNKTNDENRMAWMNPSKNALSSQQQRHNNWSNKFGSIKNTFEQHESQKHLSPVLNKKNNFTHAPTSPFKPVPNSRPPHIPNGTYHYHNQNQQVLQKIAAIQSNEIDQSTIVKKPQLRTQKSMPEGNNGFYHSPNSQFKSSEWPQNKYALIDNNNYVSSNHQSNAFNPLYKSPDKISPSKQQFAQLYSNFDQQQYSRTSSLNSLPTQNHTPTKTPVSPMSADFPSYTYTSTDFTQPVSVSTFGPEKSTPPIKATILPDTSYLKTSPQPPIIPKLGSSRLNNQLKTVDVHSSSEYLSEANSSNTYYRSPKPFSPNYENNYRGNSDGYRSSQEFTATSQIMKYPQLQMATVVNKTQRYDQDELLASTHLRSIIPSDINRNDLPKPNEILPDNYPSVSPFSESNFSHVNQMYIPPESNALASQPIRSKPVSNSNFVSMNNNVTSPKSNATEESIPIRLTNNTTFYGLNSNQKPAQYPFNEYSAAKHLQQKSPEAKTVNDIKSKITPPVRLNSSGGHYIQPKVEPEYHNNAGPSFAKKSTNIIKNNVSNVNRSQTITHQRVANIEVKRKQSLPAQKSDYFDSVYNENESNDVIPTHNYLPSGVLKRSKSSHTLALLQQFESKGKSAEATDKTPLPSYVKKPDIKSPINEKPKKSISSSSAVVEPKPKPIISSQPKEFKEQTKPLSEPKPKSILASKTRHQESEEFKIVPEVKTKPILSHQLRESEEQAKTTEATIKLIEKEIQQQLEAPAITETPSSPCVEDGHIIYPGQTTATRNRVQHYAQTLNAMLNRKSIVLDDDNETDSDKNTETTPATKTGVQRSKSGTLLAVPKQYESAIKKSEVEEKERTVAAYFAASKSPSQSLQRSSSQHSVLSSASMKSVSRQEEKSNTVSPLQMDDTKSTTINQSNEMSNHHSHTESITTTTTSTKSAHHLKILRKQQKHTTTNLPLAKSQTLPSINLLDESNVDDAFEDLFASFISK